MTDEEYRPQAPASTADAGGAEVGTQAVSRDELCDAEPADVGTQAASAADLDVGTQQASVDDLDVGTQQATLGDLDVGTQYADVGNADDQEDGPTDRVSGRSGPTIPTDVISALG